MATPVMAMMTRIIVYWEIEFNQTLLIVYASIHLCMLMRFLFASVVVMLV